MERWKEIPEMVYQVHKKYYAQKSTVELRFNPKKNHLIYMFSFGLQTIIFSMEWCKMIPEMIYGNHKKHFGNIR